MTFFLSAAILLGTGPLTIALAVLFLAPLVHTYRSN